jgi:hypothetical protein
MSQPRCRDDFRHLINFSSSRERILAMEAALLLHHSKMDRATSG